MLKVWFHIKLRLMRRLAPREQGFSLIEILLAVAVFGTLATSLLGAIVYGRSSTADSGDRARAIQIADEGVQAARNIHDAAAANLVNGNTYGLAQSAGTWITSGAFDTTGIFKRTVAVSAGGTNRQNILVTVTWTRINGTTGSVTSTAEFSTWPANILQWTATSTTGSANPATTGVKVATQGIYAYEVLSTAANNFVVINISNPASPSVTSTTTFGGGIPTNIFVSGNFAYVTTATNTSGLEIINISNPAAPTLTKAVSLIGAVSANGVYVSGNYAYLTRNLSGTAGANEFTVVDVSTPATAFVAGGLDAGIQTNEVYVSGNFAYVATGNTSQEMLIINIATPTAPTMSGGATYNAASPNLSALTITGFGTTILLGMGTIVDAVNVATPTAPARLTTFTSVGTVQDLAVDITNKYAFIGTNSTTGEFQVINLVGSPISSMTLAKTVDVTGTTSTINGVAYNTSFDVVAASSISTTQRFLTFTRK